MSQWLTWITNLQAIAQNGLTYATDPFDTERYQSVQQIAAEMLSALSSQPVEHLHSLLIEEQGYATPKIDVRAGVIHDGRILLVKERADGLWSLPGGWVDVNSSPKEAAEKETREESGYEVCASKLVALHDLRKQAHPPHLYHIYKAFFLCDLISGEPKINIEISDIDFFRVDQLPPLSLPRVLPEQIEMLFRHHLSPCKSKNECSNQACPNHTFNYRTF